MIRDAEINAAEDRRRREEAEVRNEADSLAYQAKRQLEDLKDRVLENEKERINRLVEEINEALKENAQADRVKRLAEDLRQAMYSLSQAAYTGEGCQPGDRCGADGGKGYYGAGRDGGDDVVDAEYEVR